jgi:hypothetical protein
MKLDDLKNPEKRRRVMDFLQSVLMTAAGIVLLFFMILVAFKVVGYIWSSWKPTREILVGNFTAGAGTLPETAGSAGKILGAKLERLKRFSRKGTRDYWLIQAPTLVAVPDQLADRQGDTRRRLEAINLKVKDVAVGDVAKLFDIIFEPARPRLEGTITDYGDRIEVRSELLWKNGVLDGWVASRAESKATNAPQKDELLNDLYDDLVFQMIYDLPKNAKLPWFTKYSTGDETPNWQTLEALTLGMEALDNYRLSLDYQDLKRSLQYLDRIPTYAPGYSLGHYFLALALGEDRQEERAANVFGEVENMDSTAQLRWAAKYQQAAAMLRQYRSQPATDAAESILIPLIQELKTASGKDSSAEGKDSSAEGKDSSAEGKDSSAEGKDSSAEGKARSEDAKFAVRLTPLAEAQLSYTYSTMLTLNTSISDNNLQLNAEKYWKEANVDFNGVTEWLSDRDKNEVLSWILNAEGYGSYRIAEWKLNSGTGDIQNHQKLFRQACNEALKKLEKANQLDPNNYEILQNQAMILDNEQFDPEGKHRVEAESIYERTKRFVPRDYYQYERLARIFWLRTKSQPVPTLRRDLIKSGIDNVNAAQGYRPNARTAAACGTYFFIASADTEDDAAKQKTDIQTAMANGELVLNLKAENLEELKPIISDAVTLMFKVAPRISDQSEKDALTALANKLK